MVQLMIGALLALVVSFPAFAEEEVVAPTGEVVTIEVEETRAQKFAKMYEPNEVVTTPTADPVICNPDSDTHCAPVSDDIGNWEKVKEIAAATGLKIKVFFVGES